MLFRSSKVQCWIFSTSGAGEPVCLLLRTTRKRGSFWQPVTGSAEAGEPDAAAALREATEETGFAFAPPPADTGYEFAFTSRFGEARERVFAAKVPGAQPPKLDPREHDAFQWIAPADALELVRFPSNRDGLRHAYRLIWGKDLPKDQDDT